MAASKGSSVDTDIVVADSQTVSLPLRLPSHIYVEQDAAIGARSAGVLRGLSVDLGSVVEAGAVIGTLEDELQRLAVQRATVANERAQRIVMRARELARSNNIPSSEVEDAEDQARLADVTKREADQALERTRVIAPYGGVITARYVQPGRLLALHDSVVRLTANGPWLARIRIPETSARAVRIGSSVPVISVNGARLAGRVRRLAPMIDAASGTREAVIEVASLNRNALAGGSVQVELPRVSRTALSLPRTAVTSDGNVLVVNGRRTVLRPVVIGAAFGDRIEVLSGLQVGERVRRVAR